MAKIDDSAAFPDGYRGESGMRLRDYFAGQALAGLLAWSPDGSELQYDPDTAAEKAYEMADAMLAERKKATGGDK